MAIALNKVIFEKAVQLLAQRDYSTKQLSQKLFVFFSKKDDQLDAESLTQAINDVITRCQQSHWLDDMQYIKKYIEMRSRKGFGKNRIVLELKQRGLKREMIDALMQQIDIDWVEIALHQLNKKFKEIDKNDLKQKRQIIQFLLYRGFSQTEVNSAYRFTV